MRHRLHTHLLISALLCGSTPALGQATEDAQVFTLAGLDVSVRGDLGPFELSVTTSALDQGLEVAVLHLVASEPAPPGPVSLEFSIPSHDVAGLWTTSAGFDKGVHADWAMSGVRSMLAQNAPVLTLFGGDDGNRLTFAVSDALNTVRLRAGVREEDGRVYAGVDLFTEPHRAVDSVAVAVRFDRRTVPYHASLRQVSDWWASQAGYTPAPVPEAARQPMYSTWYGYHQSLDPAALLREVEIAADLGYEAIIVDDGWQTLDAQRGYAYTGDWEPERIPQMRAFVDGVHERGMRFLLWYAVPLVGEHSAVFERFRGKYLRYWDGQGAWELDPRYPEVRAHIIDTYRQAMRDWGVDGFKLDFLGRFVANETTDLTLADGRDYASVNDATDRLMTDILQELRQVDPDVMIEFRQPYIGPLMRKYGNMFRAGDAPNAIARHRVRVVDLRLLSGNTAVHSDMMMWHYDEPTEIAALQFLNVIFSVPQMSVRLEGVPGSRPTRFIDVLNGASDPFVALDVQADLGRYAFTVTDALGARVESGEVDLTAGLHRFDVPVAGMVSLERIASTGG
jgi:alpha-galactosidase